MNEQELTKATGMLWRSEERAHGEVLFFAVDKVHGTYFSVLIRPNYHTRLLADNALETDVLGTVLGVPRAVLSTLERSNYVDIVPEVLTLATVRQFVATYQKRSRAVPGDIELLRSSRLAFHKKFLPVTEVLPFFRFYKLRQSNQGVPGTRFYFQDYHVPGTESFIRPNGSGDLFFNMSIDTDRESVFQAFSKLLLEVPFGEAIITRCQPGKRLSVKYNFVVDDQLANLVEFAESPLGRLYQQYSFDRIPK